MLILLAVLLVMVAAMAAASIYQIYRVVAPQAHAPTGETCGGVAATSCRAEYVCEYPNGEAIDSVGVCVPEPQE